MSRKRRAAKAVSQRARAASQPAYHMTAYRTVGGHGADRPAGLAGLIAMLRQAVRLSVFWVAICVSLGGMLTYTKSGLEVLLADVINAPPAKSMSLRAQRGL